MFAVETFPQLGDGLCRDFEPDLMFPEPTDRAATARAVAVCRGCPVRAACLTWALANPALTEYGVWGGTTPAQRRRKRNRPVRCAVCRRVVPDRRKRTCSDACAAVLTPDATGSTHGSEWSYRKHKAAGEQACRPCLDAHNGYVREKRAEAKARRIAEAA